MHAVGLKYVYLSFFPRQILIIEKTDIVSLVVFKVFIVVNEAIT